MPEKSCRRKADLPSYRFGGPGLCGIIMISDKSNGERMKMVQKGRKVK
ncbi:hypothetical protein QBE55_00675 [Eubacteriales bacterium mix99]|jgi:hypothetical protein